MEFNVGYIIELTKDVLFYDRGLIAQVTEIEDGEYGWVKILENKDKEEIGVVKHANLTLFKLVRRGGFHV